MAYVELFSASLTKVRYKYVFFAFSVDISKKRGLSPFLIELAKIYNVGAEPSALA